MPNQLMPGVLLPAFGELEFDPCSALRVRSSDGVPSGLLDHSRSWVTRLLTDDSVRDVGELSSIRVRRCAPPEGLLGEWEEGRIRTAPVGPKAVSSWRQRRARRAARPIWSNITTEPAGARLSCIA
jgi:hypothetical protein